MIKGATCFLVVFKYTSFTTDTVSRRIKSFDTGIPHLLLKLNLRLEVPIPTVCIGS